MMCSRLILASRSPRREFLLREAGFACDVFVPEFDDASLRRPSRLDPARWVQALATLKAQAAVTQLIHDEASANSNTRIVLAADTVCACDATVLGQPSSAAEAATMIATLRNRSHRTVTGVCLVQMDGVSGPSCIEQFSDTALVTVGDISDKAIAEYAASGDWRGKAGGYNLSERLAAGWPITVQGDPATVMGLPMMRLRPILRKLGV